MKIEIHYSINQSNDKNVKKLLLILWLIDLEMFIEQKIIITYDCFSRFLKYIYRCLPSQFKPSVTFYTIIYTSPIIFHAAIHHIILFKYYKFIKKKTLKMV